MNKLGFGFLRIPQKDGEYDIEGMFPVVDAAMAGGCNYFDTAYSYLNGMSETGLRKALVERYPRESFKIATKLAGYRITDKADCRRQFDEQLQRCGVTYFDVYMLHWLNKKHYAIAEKYDEFGFLQRLKESGEARATGFSYHDTPELLDEILSAHPEVDYVLLQINYLDWDSPAIQSRRCYETAVRHGKKVIVMEPVKGGTLAALPGEAERLLCALSPGQSMSSYALRFAMDLPGVEIVLSGMNQVTQVEDNLQDFEPLTDREREALTQAAGLLNNSVAVGCTACGYCLKYCPKAIPVPEYFKLYNELKRHPGDDWKIVPVYSRMAQKHPAASGCIGCGSCEAHCPQHLSIRDYLKDVAASFERG